MASARDSVVGAFVSALEAWVELGHVRIAPMEPDVKERAYSLATELQLEMDQRHFRSLWHQYSVDAPNAVNLLNLARGFIFAHERLDQLEQMATGASTSPEIWDGSMSGDLPPSDASPSAWINSLASQPLPCRALPYETQLNSDPVSGRSPSTASGERPALCAARYRIAMHRALSPTLNFMDDEELRSWPDHAAEFEKSAIAAELVGVLAAAPDDSSAERLQAIESVADSIIRSLLALAVRTGAQWTGALEHAQNRLGDAASHPQGAARVRSLLKWSQSLKAHRAHVLKEARDVRQLAILGHVGMPAGLTIARHNRHLGTEQLVPLLVGEGPTGPRLMSGNMLLNAANNPHATSAALTEGLTLFLSGHDRKGRGLARESPLAVSMEHWLIETLHKMAERAGGIFLDRRLLDAAWKLGVLGVSRSYLSALLNIPGMEHHPAIAERLKRERSLEVLSVVMRNPGVSEKHFARYLGRMLTELARLQREGRSPDYGRFGIPLEEILSSAPPGRLASVPLSTWRKALTFPDDKVRLEAQLAMGRMAEMGHRIPDGTAKRAPRKSKRHSAR